MDAHRLELDYNRTSTATPTHQRTRAATLQITHSQTNHDTATMENRTIQTDNTRLTNANRILQQELNDNTLQIDDNDIVTRTNNVTITNAETEIAESMIDHDELTIVGEHMRDLTLVHLDTIIDRDARVCDRLQNSYGRRNLKAMTKSILSIHTNFPPRTGDGYTNKTMANAYAINYNSGGWNIAVKHMITSRYLERELVGKEYVYTLHPRMVKNLPIESRPTYDPINQARFQTIFDHGRQLVAANTRTPTPPPRQGRVSP